MKQIIPKIVVIVFTALVISSCASSKSEKDKEQVPTEALVTITTKFGEIKLILFDDTPVHKQNFLSHAMAGRYNGTIFHRVIDNFMIQGGHFKPENQAAYDSLPFEKRTLPAEFKRHYKHIRGAIAAARVPNEEKRSDDRQFYIVQNFNGAHPLDMGYTVFGQTIVGMDVVDKIAKVKKVGNKPAEDISMQIRIDIVPKKDIIKYYGDVYAKYKIPQAVK